MKTRLFILSLTCCFLTLTITAQQDASSTEKSSESMHPHNLVSDRNGNTYTFATMKDGQKWLTQNLNIATPGSFCYDTKEFNCEKYGRLYIWESAVEACKQLGTAWRLPTDLEWQNLIKQYDENYNPAQGESESAYRALLSQDKLGFAALPGGFRDSFDRFFYQDLFGYYWTSTESYTDFAQSYLFRSDYIKLYSSSSDKNWAFSCRCIMVE